MNTNLTVGLYPGTFSPFHIGHLSIVKQSIDLFDRVVVAKGVNPQKMNKIINDYPLPENFLKRMGVEITTYNTLLVDLVKKYETQYNVTLIRGLRNGADLEYEQNIVAFLKGMYPQIKVVAFYCDPKFRHISSSALREIRHFSDDEYKKYVITD